MAYFSLLVSLYKLVFFDNEYFFLSQTEAEEMLRKLERMELEKDELKQTVNSLETKVSSSLIEAFLHLLSLFLFCVVNFQNKML